VVWKPPCAANGAFRLMHGCVRTIVVWKLITTRLPSTGPNELRENHSGMETQEM